MDLRQVFKRYGNVFESFTRKIRSKKNDELTTKADTAFVPDGVYILHETLGVKTVDSWNPKNNNGVVGILLVEDDHKIVVATEDAPEDLPWSNEYRLINQPVDELEDAKSDFNGEYYCRRLDSPDFPDAYYCKTYNKGNRDWYLPSSGELWMIYNHLEEIQNALSIVGGQKFDTNWDEGVPVYWSSTERSASNAWYLYLNNGNLIWRGKVNTIGKVRPVSKFDFSTLKESFTRKIRSKKNDELTSKPSFELDNGVYILHETLGVKSVEGWNPKNNNGVVGILLVEDDHKIVVATEDSPENLTWSKKRGLINQPVDFFSEDAKSDFNGEYYCRKLDSPDFPAAYYCKTYNKGNRDWYLPSTGELWLIYNHLEEIQNALSIVGGQKFIFTWDEGIPLYWSSTEDSAMYAWNLYLYYGTLDAAGNKVSGSGKVRPVSKFGHSNTLKESFTKKISSKKNTDLISKPSFVLEDGVYILHETLGVRDVEGWNPKFNKGVVGILLVEDDHKIVVALEDSPKNLIWSEERKLVNQPVENRGEAKSDFNGELYCRKLNSPEYPAAYYCLNYKKGNRSWYLPSSGELWLIYRHLEEIQSALKTVRGKKFVTTWDDEAPCYWSSTEYNHTRAWHLFLHNGNLCNWYNRGNVAYSCNVRPVSKFGPSTLKESFTRKISSKKNDELTAKADTAFVPDGVYILHETLGVKTLEKWSKKLNNGVVGILLVEDDHQIVVALEDSPEDLPWSNERELINQPVDKLKDAESDFNGEEYCIKLNSPDFPAAYYCLNYKKDGRNWYLPSSGELWLIYRHLEEIQTALSIVGGQKFVTTFNYGVPCYWSSTEYSVKSTLHLPFDYGHLVHWNNKISTILKVRPVSNFNLSELKESFTKKIGKKNVSEIIGKSERVFLEESITQMVYSFGKYDMVQDIDKKHILGYELPYGCLPKFFESKKFVDNGDVIKRTETCSPMGYTLRYEIVASHIYFNPLRKKVYVGMYRPSPLNQSESSPKIYNLYGAASSGILELDDFSIDELRQILQNIQERTKMKKPLRKKIVLKR